MAKRRIVVVEDERDMAELVAMRLEREHFDVEVARDGVEALETIGANPPDLVLLDLMLPKMSGTEVAAELRHDPRTKHVPIIMLTAKSEETDIVVGLELGTDDYVTKPFSMSVLVARIAVVLRRAEHAASDDSGVLSAGPIRIDTHRYKVQVAGKPVALTLTESRLLAAIVAGRGRVLTRDRLIDHAIGPDAVVTGRTIDVHLAALRRKLGRARCHIETVRGVGYRLMIEEDETA